MNNATLPDLPSRYPNWPQNVLHAIILGLISAWATSTNSVFLIIVFKSKLILKISTLILASLSVANLLIGLTIPLLIYSVCFRRPFDPTSAVLLGIIAAPVLSFHFHILLLTVDRFTAVVQPLRYKTIVTKRRVAICIALIWLLAIVRAVLGIILGDLDRKVVQLRGNTLITYKKPSPKYGSFVDFSLYISTSVLFICMYAQICRIARRHCRDIRMMRLSQRGETSARRRGSLRNTRNFTCILLFYVITWLPLWVCQFMRLFAEVTTSVLMAQLFSLEVGLLNICINLTIYVLTNQDFKQAYKRLF